MLTDWRDIMWIYCDVLSGQFQSISVGCPTIALRVKLHLRDGYVRLLDGVWHLNYSCSQLIEFVNCYTVAIQDTRIID